MLSRWGRHELQFLREHYSTKGPDYCSKSLARTVPSVQRQAHRLGISNPDRGFSRNKKAQLYFVSFIFDGIEYYKIGITNKTARERLGSDWNKFNFKLIWNIESDNGKYIADLERKILNENKQFLINTEALASGNTETLTVLIQQPKE